MNVYLLLIIAVACITWTVTKEEIFRPMRVWLDKTRSLATLDPWTRPLRWWEKLLERALYIPTCDYCLGHWVMLAAFLIVGPPALVVLPHPGGEFIGQVLTYFVLVAGTAVTTTLFSVVRQFNKLLTEVAKWHEQQNQLPYGVSSKYAWQKAT